MVTLAPSQDQSRLRSAKASFVRNSQWLGILAGTMALAVMFGWHTHNAFLIQLRSDLVPLPYNSALLMLLGSLTLVALIHGRVFTGRLLAGLALLISAVTLAQYFTGIDAGIDQLLMQHYLTAQTAYPGRMAISTAFSYLILNTGFLLFTLDQSGRHVRAIASVCAAIVIASVIATVIGYEADLQPLFGWSATTYMALHSALGIFVLGLGLLACSLGTDDEILEESHVVTATSGFIVIVTATLLLWSGLTRQRDEQLQATLDADLRWLGIGISSLYEERANTIERMSRRWETGGGTDRVIWESDAESYVETLAGTEAIYRIAPDGMVEWAVPPAVGSLASGDNAFAVMEAAESFLQARDSGATTHSVPFRHASDGGIHFLLVRPLFVDSRADGYIVAEFHADEMFDMVHEQDPTVPFRIRYAGNTVHSNLQEIDGDADASASVVAVTPLAIGGSGWSLQVFPQQLRDLRTKLPNFVLVAGILLALFLAAVLHLWGTAQRSLVAASRANAELERNRQQLNQFRTTLDLTLDCVFMFDAQSFYYFYGNEGALRLTGRTLPELMNMRAWEVNPNRTEAGFRELVAPLLNKEQDSLTFDSALLGAGGNLVPVECFMQYIAPANEPARFVTIVRDITQRKRIEQMKSEFVSTVSHELRTPLTSITGALGLIEGGALGEVSAPAMEMISIAHKNSRRLTHLINDLLDIEKIAAGKVVFDMQTQPLMPLVEQAVEGTRTYGTEHRVSLSLVHAEPGVDIHVDSQRLLQILSNLLSNAIKFSPEGGEVEISVELHAPKVRISVRDRGRGIPAEFRGRIFQKFAQADASDTRKQSGTGLGLAISRELAERMNARLDYDSVPGEGACFYLELEALTRKSPAKPAEPPAAGKTAPTNTAATKAQLRVLHIEDDADLHRVIRGMAGPGVTVAHAASLAEAHKALAFETFDAVILDLGLPDGSGLELVPEIREALPDARLVILSGREPPQFEPGMVDAVLLKANVTPRQLLEATQPGVAETPLPPLV